MKLVVTDLRRLRGSLAAALLMLAVGAAASYFALAAHASARRAQTLAQTQRNEITGNLQRVRSEEHEIETKAKVLAELAAAGIIGSERRLEWVELIKAIGAQRGLADLRYEIAAQRALEAPPQTGFAFYASTMTLHGQMLHEEQLTRLLADLRARASALIDVRRCTLARLPTAADEGAQLQADCEIDWITLREVSRQGRTLHAQ